MKRLAFFLLTVLISSIACSVASTPTQVNQPNVEIIVAATMQALAPSPEPQPTTDPTPQFNGTEINTDSVSLVIPTGMAAGAMMTKIPPSGADTPHWELTPGHDELKLNGYVLQNRFHEPKIIIYPAGAFAAMNDGAAENVRRLQIILANPVSPLSDDLLPHVPFFNAGAVITAQTETIRFKNGVGVRMLTQYAQSYAIVNNHELFYHFQGLTSDGGEYIIVILPISAPFLAENWEATVPADGIPFPGYSNPNADFEAYYQQLTEKLNTTQPENFTPSLSALDALIQSLLIKGH
jgi:hypothetical protein